VFENIKYYAFTKCYELSLELFTKKKQRQIQVERGN